YAPQEPDGVDVSGETDLSISGTSMDAEASIEDIVVLGSEVFDDARMPNKGDKPAEENTLLEDPSDKPREQEPSKEISTQQHEQFDSLHTILEAVVSTVSQRDRQVLELRYGLQDGYTRT